MGEAAKGTTRHAFEFRGTGWGYFRIWVVNLALTIVTVGIFSAWAKVRTRRYFNGSTWLAGHTFDYHASGWRILVGRTIALILLLGYNITVAFKPILAAPWILIGLSVFPWLVNSSIRFNARNTSYRNVRFNFTATNVEALVAFIVWPILGFCTLLLLLPAAQRVREYFIINNHTFGGRYFETKFSLGRIYAVFGLGLLLFLLLLAGIVAAEVGVASAIQHHLHKSLDIVKNPAPFMAMVMVAFYVPLLLIAPFVHTMIVNLSVKNTVFDERHHLQSNMSPFTMTWIMVTNVILTILTLGLFYPWAKVRQTRYQLSKMALIADGDIDNYVSEVFSTQSAVGEEIGSLFSFDFGL